MAKRFISSPKHPDPFWGPPMALSLQVERSVRDSDHSPKFIGRGRFFFNHSIETARGPTKPNTVWLLDNRPQVVKHPATEATHLPAFRAQVKSAWSYAPISSYVFLAWYSDTYFRIRIYLRVGS
jgi:hypothetical protein